MPEGKNVQQALWVWIYPKKNGKLFKLNKVLIVKQFSVLPIYAGSMEHLPVTPAKKEDLDQI